MKSLVSIVTLLFLSVKASAGVIIAATQVDVSAPDDSIFGQNTSYLIDQSGLSDNYVNGVTDFDSFVSSTTATYGFNPSYGLGGVAGLGSFYFDLGANHHVDSIATWGQDAGSSTMTGFDLYMSDTFGSAGTRELIGSFSAGQSPAAYVQSFASVSAQYFEIKVTGNQGARSATRINEVVFGGQFVSVSEPWSLLLMGLGLSGLGWIRKQS